MLPHITPSPDLETWERLAVLGAFRAAVWGNDHIFKEYQTRHSGSDTRTVEYLNFADHRAAVALFCSALRDKKLLVVQEYRDAMDKFRGEDVGYEKGACIIGQPGIGKSFFVAYAVTERLRERKPVAVHVFWHQPDSYILFSKDAVTLHNRSQTTLLNLPGIWAFSDCNEELRIPPYAFLHTPGVRVFQTTCPIRSCWKHWTKEFLLYFMDLWSMAEIEDLAFLFHPGQVDLAKSLAIQWGPVPRILLLAISDPGYIEYYEATINRLLAAVVCCPDSVFRAIWSLDNAIHSDSSSLFFVKPLNKKTRTVFSASIPTHTLVDRLVTELGHSQVETKAKFFHSLRTYSTVMHSVAECIFQEMVHRSHSLIDEESHSRVPFVDTYMIS